MIMLELAGVAHEVPVYLCDDVSSADPYRAGPLKQAAIVARSHPLPMDTAEQYHNVICDGGGGDIRHKVMIR